LQHHTFLARGYFDDLRGRTNRHRFIFCQRLIDHQIEPGQFHRFEPLFGDRKNVWPGRDIQEDEVAGVACGRVVDDVGVLIGKCSRGPATTAPVESVTVPFTPPVARCANNAVGVIAIMRLHAHEMRNR
jgi:hypothetical protein